MDRLENSIEAVTLNPKIIRKVRSSGFSDGMRRIKHLFGWVIVLAVQHPFEQEPGVYIYIYIYMYICIYMQAPGIWHRDEFSEVPCYAAKCNSGPLWRAHINTMFRVPCQHQMVVFMFHSLFLFFVCLNIPPKTLNPKPHAFSGTSVRTEGLAFTGSLLVRQGYL